MFLRLEPVSEKPLYQQIRDEIIEGLASGQLANGDSLPSTRQLAMDFGINFHTVNKAYDMLRHEGIISLNRKTGAVVTLSKAGDEFVTDWSTCLRTLLAEMFVKGMDKDELLKRCSEAIDSFVSPNNETK